MKIINALLGLVFLTMLAGGEGQHALAQTTPTPEASPVTITLPGSLTNDQGEAVADATIKVKYAGKLYEATSESDGGFSIDNVDISKSLPINFPGTLTDPDGKPISNSKVQVTLDGTRYSAVTDEKGNFLIKGKTYKGYLIPFLLMVPGLLALLFATIKTDWQNEFLFALVNSITWISVLFGLAFFGIKQLHFFDQTLEFSFSVPILGFLGAMLFVLDMFHKGREDIQRGKEFGIRIIMGPYVAIVMVLLLVRGIGLAELKDPAKEAAVAFFSGLLVVYAFQIIVEFGQEFLGNIRQKIRYEPSEIAVKFKLKKDDDLKLRVAGITHLFQLGLYSEAELKNKAITVKIDENLLIGIKREYEKIILENEIGDIVWEELKKKNVKTLGTFAMLRETDINDIAAGAKMIDGEQLKMLLGKAKKLIAMEPQITQQ